MRSRELIAVGALGGFALGFMAPALAQLVGTPVTTFPSPGNTTNASGALADGTAYQQIFAATRVEAPRKGCLIVNIATTRAWVFFGPVASATKDTSLPLEPATGANAYGGALNCGAGTVGALQDQVSIQGTMSAKFVALSW